MGENGWKWKINYDVLQNNNELLAEAAELEVLSRGCSPILFNSDRVVWPFDSGNQFSVKSCYVKLEQGRVSAALSVQLKKALVFVWKSKVPHKVQVLGWRLLQERLLTRELLQQRGIIEDLDNSRCDFGNVVVESCSHLFIHCIVARAIWRLIFCWLDLKENDVELNLGDTCCSFSLKFHTGLFRKASCFREGVIWLTTVWCIWIFRNGIIFKNEVDDVEELVFKIKMHFWWWLQIDTNRLHSVIFMNGVNIHWIFCNNCV
ncbi:uncharacterized protein LOC131649496 [Vicia villosa]|uniref:uncharacterized protein LOC131649496 n=1 Tax=Vicia villosa TaxID=3911 RepID=UPI00273C8348|nr:uncharacterized protein LOC131649496 [Vicia villosa]